MDYLQVIIQGGAVGLAAYLIFVGQKLIGNHMTHNTEAVSKNTEAISALSKNTAVNTEVLRGIKEVLIKK